MLRIYIKKWIRSSQQDNTSLQLLSLAFENEEISAIRTIFSSYIFSVPTAIVGLNTFEHLLAPTVKNVNGAA
jgi:hypothetical protein